MRLRRAANWVVDREMVFMLAVLALSTWNVWGMAWALILAAGLWVLRWVGRGRLTVCTPLDGPACVLLAIVPLSLWVSPDRTTTFIALGRLLIGLALAYGIANWAQRPGQLAAVALGLIGLGLGLVALAPVSVAWPGGKLALFPQALYDRTRVLVGDVINPNMMAGALVVLFPFPAVLALQGRPLGRWVGPAFRLWRGPSVARSGASSGARPGTHSMWWPWRIVLGLCALSMLGVLVLTQSRGGWIAAAVGVLVLLIGLWRPLGLLLIPAGAALAWLVWREGAAFLDRLSFGGSLASWSGRIEIWDRSVMMIQDFWLTGVGAGNFEFLVRTLYPLFFKGPGSSVPHAHNLFLQVAVDLGVPGLIAYLAVLLVGVWSAVHCIRLYRKKGWGLLAALAWASLISLVGMCVHGLTDATSWIVGRGAFVPWAVIGLLVALLLAQDWPMGREGQGSPGAVR